MVRLMLLAGAWLLMRRYIFRRRGRIQRETLLSKMRERLRTLAKFRPRRRAGTPPLRPSLAAPPGTGGFPSQARNRASHSSSSFRSACRQRSGGLVPGL
jgi:hypothetical protein